MSPRRPPVAAARRAASRLPGRVTTREAVREPAGGGESREREPQFATFAAEGMRVVNRYGRWLRWREAYPERDSAEFPDQARRRLIVLLAIVAVVFGLIALRLVSLQGLDTARYAALGTGQRVKQAIIPAGRGGMVDRSGRALAVTADVPSVYADPQEVKDAAGTSRQLGGLLADDKTARNIPDNATLTARLQSGKKFAWVARKVSPATADAVRKMKLPGVYVTTEPDRQYPSGTLAAGVLGFTDIDDRGQAGIERSLDKTLTGRQGGLLSEKDPHGRPIPGGVYELKPAQPGRDVQVTLDSGIQSEAEAALDDAVQKYAAKGGVIAVMDPHTGDLLAYASRPTFDPNDPAASGNASLRAWGVGDVFEPGSTSKVVTMSAALEEHVVTPDTTLDVPDAVKVWDRVIHDDEPHDTQTWSVRDIVTQSSNVGTILVANKLGSARLAEYMAKFGYGRKTGIELPGESRGLVKPLDAWNGPDVAEQAIGHTVAVTPLQMLRVFGTIANGGVMVEPRLVAGTFDATGVKSLPRPVPQRIVSAQTAALMRGMLQNVVTEGTGTEAAVPGYTVAGKTGTAEKVLPGGKGYMRDKTFASFVGFAPVENPRAVTIVVLDEPNVVYGGSSSAPTFSRVMRFVMREMDVPPSAVAQVVKAAPPLKKTGNNSIPTIRPATPKNDPRAASATTLPQPPDGSDVPPVTLPQPDDNGQPADK